MGHAIAIIAIRCFSDYSIVCTPATSAPVERSYFHMSGIIMRPHRVKMSDTLLETLVFLKYNSMIRLSLIDSTTVCNSIMIIRIEL